VVAGGAGGFQMSGSFVMGPIERSGGRGVKWKMDRVRTVICSLLPALWLLAAGHCLADSVSGCTDGCCQTSVSETKGDGHQPLTDARASDQGARLLNRRLGPQTGWAGLLTPAAVPASGLGEPEDASAPVTVSSDAPGLAKCWQFYWRTACEPRAPSSVS
jgi:hypothetical protein